MTAAAREAAAPVRVAAGALEPDADGLVPCLPCHELGIAPDDPAANCEYCGGDRRTTRELLAAWLPEVLEVA